MSETFSLAASDGATSGANTRISSRASSPTRSVARAPVSMVKSPMRNANTSQPPPLRRSSSAMSTGASGPVSSPKLNKKSSRSSLGSSTEQNERKLTPKRSISNLIAGLREAQSSMATIEEPVPLTAAQIARAHFTRELSVHGQSSADAETMVILHDACYGHRWSRLRTTKSVLSMIVERPERLRASVLGASLAYVRLGEHHAGGRFAPHPHMTGASTATPFSIRSSRRSLPITDTCVTNVHGRAWMAELGDLCDSAAQRLSTGLPELKRSANADGTDKTQLHEGDLYLSPESREAFEGALGGVADAVDAVFSTSTVTKKAFVAVRPPGHHCSADLPSGFCWLNNVHVGIEYAAQKYGLTHAAILDFDLHHGDGSQTIAWARNAQNQEKRLYAKPNSRPKLNPDIGYYSLHDINSYPCEMGEINKVQAASLCIDDAHGQSVWNVHLEPWKNENEFWDLYESKYTILLDKARSFLRKQTLRITAEGRVQPRAALFISAGFDASEWEGSGMQRHKVNVPTEFYARFTNDVVRLANELDSGCEGRVISILEGGYSDRALCSGVLSHLSGLCSIPDTTGGSSDMQKLNAALSGLRIGQSTYNMEISRNRTWWSDANLTALENTISPPPPIQGKKIRVGSQPTYATPTESFAYKVIDPDRFARSVSGTLRDSKPSRPVTPPPPEVNWITATQELSALLIPQDRTTTSCTAEELTVPKIKKEKFDTINETDVTATPTANRQLRERRKTRSPGEFDNGPKPEATRAVTRPANRRKTMHELPLASGGDSTLEIVPPRRESRRSSALPAELKSMAAASPPYKQKPNASARPSAPRASSNLAIKTIQKPIKPTEESGRTMNNTEAPDIEVALCRPGSQDSSLNMSANSTKESPASDLDNLTSSMKKITLKVGTREDHERKQKDREAAERRARALKAAETRKINAAAKRTAVATNDNLPNTAPRTRSPTKTARVVTSSPRKPNVKPIATMKPLIRADSSTNFPGPTLRQASSPAAHLPCPHQAGLQTGTTNSGLSTPVVVLEPASIQTPPGELKDDGVAPHFSAPQPFQGDQIVSRPISPSKPASAGGVQRNDLPQFTSSGFIPFAPK